MPIEIVRRVIDTPFKVSFRHASAERSAAQSVWVEAADGGLLGLGEGCPREYVTGENVPGALEFIDNLIPEICTIDSITDLQHWVAGNRERINKAPAAWCAIELAFLDLLARREAVSVEQLLGLPESTGRFRYTAVLGDSADAVFFEQMEQYKALGFRDFKLKVSGDPERDAQRIDAIQAPEFKLRLDANNLWRNTEALAEWRQSCSAVLSAVEEPLARGDIVALREAADILGCPIILDESFLRLEQLETLRRDPQRWIINIRISKMGGLLRSLEIVEAAREVGIRIVVGAQVGETSVLTRAALPVARAAESCLVGQEGAFGEYLLESDLVLPVLQFGARGILNADVLSGCVGWGLEPTRG